MCQYLINPSFEGTSGTGNVPPGWEVLNNLSTPDCEDTLFALTASEGESFLTLVSRGAESSVPNTFESCQAELQPQLTKGNCYTLSIDIASSDLLAACTSNGLIYYDASAVLKIYGSNVATEKGLLLGQTGVVQHTSWSNYKIGFVAEQNISYLTLEIGLAVKETGFGNLQLDNIEISEHNSSPEVVFHGILMKEDLPYTLSASSGISYSWTPVRGLSCYSCQNPSVLIDSSEIYTCVIEDEFGCKSIETFILEFNNTSAELEITIPEKLLIKGCSVEDIIYPPFNMDNTLIETADFLGIPETGIKSNCGISAVYYLDRPFGECPTSITRTYRIYDSCNNVALAIQNIIIEDDEPPFITAPFDTVIYDCNLNSVKPLSYTEHPTPVSPEKFSMIGGASIYDDCLIPSLIYQDTLIGDCPGEVIRTFTASDQCFNTSTVSQIITLDEDWIANNIFIPNVFTPNGDGINDYFEIKFLPPYSTLLVFDGSGKQVYLKENYDNTWDGRDQNLNNLKEGTYWYILIPPGLKRRYKGDVYLKRNLH